MYDAIERGERAKLDDEMEFVGNLSVFRTLMQEEPGSPEFERALAEMNYVLDNDSQDELELESVHFEVIPWEIRSDSVRFNIIKLCYHGSCRLNSLGESFFSNPVVWNFLLTFFENVDVKTIEFVLLFLANCMRTSQMYVFIAFESGVFERVVHLQLDDAVLIDLKLAVLAAAVQSPIDCPGIVELVVTKFKEQLMLNDHYNARRCLKSLTAVSEWSNAVAEACDPPFVNFLFTCVTGDFSRRCKFFAMKILANTLQNHPDFISVINSAEMIPTLAEFVLANNSVMPAFVELFKPWVLLTPRAEAQSIIESFLSVESHELPFHDKMSWYDMCDFLGHNGYQDLVEDIDFTDIIAEMDDSC